MRGAVEVSGCDEGVGAGGEGRGRVGVFLLLVTCGRDSLVGGEREREKKTLNERGHASSFLVSLLWFSTTTACLSAPPNIESWLFLSRRGATRAPRDSRCAA